MANKFLKLLALLIWLPGAALAFDSTPGTPPSGTYNPQGNVPAVQFARQPDLATVAYPGTTPDNQVLELNYGTPECWYIDNADAVAHFVPLKTKGEWDSFRTNHPSVLQISAACGSQNITTSCGDVVNVAAARNGLNQIVSAGTAGREETYACVASAGTCGGWVSVADNGQSCTTTTTTDGGGDGGSGGGDGDGGSGAGDGGI